jgi:hypothetical protein
MAGFLIEYNRRTSDWSVTQFLSDTGHRDAMKLRLERERLRTDADVEIVSLVSDSLETIQKTHSRYFAGRELVAS